MNIFKSRSNPRLKVPAILAQALFILTGSFTLQFAAAADPALIKFATLAPEGSTWMKVMREWDKELAAKSGGRLKFKIYPGGTSGDEKDVVRKIRLGQLHAGGFTGVGLGEIAPKVRILDAPFLFRNTDEVDYIYKTFEKEFDAAFEKSGYVRLGWAEVGFVYIFTAKAIENLSDLKKIRMWMWEGDPIAESAFKALGVNAIPLSITDVLTSLQTGMIDGVYSSPLAVVALQWFAKAKHMYDFQLANAAGAVLVSKKFFDGLDQDLQGLLLASGKHYLGNLTQLSRKENKSAIETLKKNGVSLVTPKAGDSDQYHATGEKARRMLVGRLYDEELLNNVEKALNQYRSRKSRE